MERVHIDGVMRPENILILPYNTIKFTDLPIQLQLNKLMENDESVEKVTINLLSRKEKSLAKYNGISEDTLNTFIENNKTEIYKYAPYTNMVKMLMTSLKQKFMGSTTMLFDNKSLNSENNLIRSAYYDGTYEGLLSYMKSSSYTCLYISDIDLLYKLANDGLDIGGKTIFVSKLGYNYEQTETGKLYLRYYKELADGFSYFDMVTFDLFDISYDSLKEEQSNGS